jgi:cell division ATPase FtsA
MVGLTITGNPIATLAVGASIIQSKERTITQADIDAGKVVNTALATAKDPKESVTDIWNYRDKRYPTDTPDTNPSYCSCENSCSRWNRKSR